jgi:hypothetical protein
VSHPGPVRRLAALTAALVLLDASVTFRNIWPTPYVRWHGELSVELAVAVLGLAIAAYRVTPISRRVIRILSVVWAALVIGRYVDVTAQAVYGRTINLYWDVRHLSSVAGLLAGAAHIWLTIAVVIAIVLVPLLVFWPVHWAFRQVAGSVAAPRVRRALAVAAVVVIVCYAAGIGTGGNPADYAGEPELTTPVTAAWARQVRLLATEMTRRGRASIPPSPPLTSSFSRIEGADVLLVFVESYGAVSWDRPAFASALEGSRQTFARDVRETGRDVVSAFVRSPTFGGSSWLAHISLLSGIEVADEDVDTVLMTQKRDTLVTTFTRHGYHTAAVMPGLQSAWPEGAFYGFDRIYGGADLEYRGPDFGWWSVPDQYTFAWIDRHEMAPPPRSPVFVVFPTITTHTPFSPIPPYQPDWNRMLTNDPYDAPAVDRALDETPDWLDLGPSYVRSLQYDFETIGGFLRRRAGRDVVMILVGDHQPPSAVSGEHASREVPVHVIASRPAVLDALVQQGFRRGLTPAHPALGGMSDLTGMLLEAFGNASH